MLHQVWKNSSRGMPVVCHRDTVFTILYEDGLELSVQAQTVQRKLSSHPGLLPTPDGHI